MIEIVQHYLLSILIFLPTAGAIAILIVRHPAVIRWIALGTAIAVFLLSLLPAIPAIYDWRSAGPYAYGDVGGVVQLVQRIDWIQAIGAQYLVGLDGLSLPLVILTALLFSLASGAAWMIERPMGFFTLLLLLETMILGSFLALDFALFFAFAVLTLPLIFFLLGWWGRSRRAAAGKVFILWFVISLLALLIVMLDAHDRCHSWDLIALARQYPQGWGGKALFLLAFLAFASRMPIVPLHFWAEETYCESPAALGIVFAAASTVGGYGLIRVAWALFPHVAGGLGPLIVLLGLLSILYGAGRALTRANFKAMIADLAVVQMGYVLLAIASAGVSAAIFMLTAQALAIALLLVAADILESRAGHAEIANFGGVGAEMPALSGIGFVALLAAIGVPGLCLFVGQLLTLIGVFSAGVGRWAHFGWRLTGLLACSTFLITAAACLGAYGKIFLGYPRQPHTPYPDLDQRELAILIPLLICIVLLGVLPWVFVLSLTQQTAAALLGGFF